MDDNAKKNIQHGLKFRYLNRSCDTKELKCCCCGNIKSIDFFTNHMIRIRYPYCKECSRKANKKSKHKPEAIQKAKDYRSRTYEYSLKGHLKKKYGITLEYYKNLLNIQNNLCAICKKENKPLNERGASFRLNVDHNHCTGAIRGLLCFNCNGGLGHFKDSKELLKKAIEYLEFYEKKIG